MRWRPGPGAGPGVPAGRRGGRRPAPDWAAPRDMRGCRACRARGSRRPLCPVSAGGERGPCCPWRRRRGLCGPAGGGGCRAHCALVSPYSPGPGGEVDALPGVGCRPSIFACPGALPRAGGWGTWEWASPIAPCVPAVCWPACSPRGVGRAQVDRASPQAQEAVLEAGVRTRVQVIRWVPCLRGAAAIGCLGAGGPGRVLGPGLGHPSGPQGFSAGGGAAGPGPK